MPTEQQQAFSKVLDLVEEAGCIEHVVLIGSWAEFAYREADVLPAFAQISKQWMSTSSFETCDAPVQRRA